MIDIVTKNVQQIGTPAAEDRIYIADKVYKRILGEEIRDRSTYVLMGHTESCGGRYATFVEDAIPLWEVEYENSVPVWNNRVWSEVFGVVKNKYENSIIVGWALDRKGYRLAIGPELERIHREQFGGAHQLFLMTDSLEKEAYFFVNKNNHLQQKTGFFVYYRLEENFSEPDRVKIEIPEEIRRTADTGYERPVQQNRPRYRDYMATQRTEIKPSKEATRGSSLLVVVCVAMLVTALGIAAYTRKDMLLHRNASVEVLSTEQQLVPVEKVSGGSLAN